MAEKGSIADILFKVPLGFDTLDVGNVLEPLQSFHNYVEDLAIKISSIQKQIETDGTENSDDAGASTSKRPRRNTRQTAAAVKVEVKEETDMNMPPPKLIPVKRALNVKADLPSQVSVKEERQSTRPKRTRGAARKLGDEQQFSNIRDSDVQIQSQRVTVIDITDSEEDEQPVRLTRTRTRAKAAEQPADTIQSTRTKTRTNKAQIAGESTQSESEEPVRSTRTRTRAAKNKANDTISSQSEDDADGKGAVKENKKHVPAAQTANDKTFVKENTSHKVPLDVTVVLSKANNTYVANEEPEITDDDSFEAPTKKPVTKDNGKKNLKEIFSPFDNNPVKKRVEAFEQFGVLKTPQQVMQTSTQAQSKRTPLGRIPTLKGFNSTSKLVSSARLKGDGNTLVMTKAASELKVSQEEFRQRELQRRKKEEEAQQKKIALLQQQAEEKRKKREEKQMKARTTREVLEKEKAEQLKQLEQAKEERRKQLLAEKEEKLQKQKEELAQKRSQALKRAAEAQKKKVPPYLLYKMPLLPTADCYDSDDEHAPKTVQKPDQQQKEGIKRLAMLEKVVLDKQLLKKFWCLRPQTPNLQDIFENIPSPKLKRNSSCIWKSFNETASSSAAGALTKAATPAQTAFCTFLFAKR